MSRRAALVGLLTLLLPSAASGQEAQLEDQPIPESTRDIQGPMRGAFEAPARQKPLIPWVSQQLAKLPPFVSESEFLVKTRTYWLRKDRADGLLSEAWAWGGSLYLKSGWWRETFQVEFEGFTSQPVVAPESKDGTLLLADGQKGYSVVAVANAKLRVQEFSLWGWRQYLELPYVNKRDNRMTPQSFEAITFGKDHGGFRFGTGWIWNVKLRNENEFVPMSEVLGVSQERGMAWGGVLWMPNEDLSIGAIAQYVPDLFNTVYGELSWHKDPFEGIDSKLELQFTQQSSVGRELLGDPFDTWNVGLKASVSGNGVVGRLGFVVTGAGSTILNPWGSSPSYVSLMQRTFNRAEEKALVASLSSDFSRIGVKNVSGIVRFASGWGGLSLLGERQDKRELDVTLDYRIEEGLFRGFWLRARASWLTEEHSPEDGTDFRVILNYEFPVI